MSVFHLDLRMLNHSIVDANGIVRIPFLDTWEEVALDWIDNLES